MRDIGGCDKGQMLERESSRGEMSVETTAWTEGIVHGRRSFRSCCVVLFWTAVTVYRYFHAWSCF